MIALPVEKIGVTVQFITYDLSSKSIMSFLYGIPNFIFSFGPSLKY